MSDARPRDEFVFLMGADVAAGLESWREPERVLELARVGIAARPGTALEEAEAAIERLGGGDRAEIVRMPEIGVSSTGIRRRVAAGRPIRHLVPEGVAGFIAERGLYQVVRPAAKSEPERVDSEAVGEAARRDRGLEEGGGRGRARHAVLVGYTDFLVVAPPATSARRRRSTTTCTCG